MRPGPEHIRGSLWVGVRPEVVSDADVAAWPFFLSVCCSRLLLSLVLFTGRQGLGIQVVVVVVSSYLELSWAFLVQSNGNGAADAAAVKLLVKTRPSRTVKYSVNSESKSELAQD